MDNRDENTLRDYFAGQALANPAICTGTAADWEMRAWFAERRGITRQDIAAKQAFTYAGAMLKARGQT